MGPGVMLAVVAVAALALHIFMLALDDHQN